MTISTPEHWRLNQQISDKKKFRGGQRKWIDIQKLCDGTINRVGRHSPPGLDIHDWNSRCEHLESGPVCGLLKKRAFSKLCDSIHARCTLLELTLYCDWFLDDYLGSYFRSKFRFEDSGGTLKDQVQIEETHKGTVEETLEMVPDYKTALKDLLSSTSNWKWEDAPNNWSQHIKIQSHKYIRKFVTEQIPCGNCFHYSHIQNLCLQKDKTKWRSARGCRQFKPIAVESAYLPRPWELIEIDDKINERAVYLLAREATKALRNNLRNAAQLGRLHSIVLHWYHEGYDEQESRDRLAKGFSVSTKTIDRDKIEIVRLLEVLKKTDTVLKKLFDSRDILADRPPDILEELEEAE